MLAFIADPLEIVQQNQPLTCYGIARVDVSQN